MGVTVQQGSATISSTEDDGAAVLANLEALDKAAPPETPAPPPAAAVEPDPSQVPDAGEGSAPDRARDESGRYAPAEAAPGKPGKPDTPEKRVARVTWEREEARRREAAAIEREAAATRRAEQLERDLADARKGVPTASGNGQQASTAGQESAKTDTEPQLESFESYESYTRALARWEVRQELKETREQQAQQQAKADEEARMGTFRDRMNEWARKHPDKVPDVAGVLKQGMSPGLSSAIIGSEHGPEVLHYLATHPEECLQLVDETWSLDTTAAPVVRRLLDRFLGPLAAPSGPAKTPTRSPDPAPIQPVGASPVVPESDPTALPFGKEYVRQMNTRDYERERRRRGLMQ